LDRQNQKRVQLGLRPIQELPRATYFWAAAASKAVAAVVTYPHEVARTRMREQARAGIFKYRGMWQTLQTMAHEEGMVSLYSGMGMHLIKVVPNSALMFLTYEVVRGYLDQYKIVD
jgi:solute carrier family 25, member 33/36